MHLADLSVGGSPHPHTQKHTNMLDGIFGGLLRSQVRCGLCLTDSVRYDTFLDLSLEVHRSVSVDKAKRSFADIDVFKGDNKYDCTVCKTKDVRHQETHSPQHTKRVATPSEEVRDL